MNFRVLILLVLDVLVLCEATAFRQLQHEQIENSEF